MQTKALILLPLLAAVVLAGGNTESNRVGRPSAVAVAKATVHTNGASKSKYVKQVAPVKKGKQNKKSKGGYGDDEEEEEEEEEEEGYGDKKKGGDEEEGDDEEEEGEEEGEEEEEGAYDARLAEVPRAQAKVIIINGSSGNGKPKEGVKRFALYNHFRGRCLAVERGHIFNRKDLYLRTVHCSQAQTFKRNSKMTFHWKDAHDNKLGYLAWFSKSGEEFCATASKHKRSTKLFPCNQKSTKYSMTETTDKNRFKIREAGQWDRCLATKLVSGMTRRSGCGATIAQEWESISVA